MTIFLKANKMVRLVLMLLATISFSDMIAQTGPAGVGTTDGTSSLKMWFRPDSGVTATPHVSAWQNSAGVAAHNLTSAGGHRPTLNSEVLNGYDVLNFDGGDRLGILGALTTSNFVTNQASTFVVCERGATTASWLYATHPHQTNRFSCHLAWINSSVYYDIGNCCSSNSRIQVGGLPNLNSYSVWSYDALSATGKQLYRDGTLVQSRNNTGTYSSHVNQTFRIGENYNGNIAEIIIFNQKINGAQRVIIENYLEAKYGLTSSANDMFDEDNPANGNFDHDFAGIGRVDASNLHDDAQGTGVVRVLNPTGLDDNEFLMWAHDGGDKFATEVLDIPATLQARFGRVWRVSEVNSSSTPIDVGSVDLRWDLTGYGAITASDLRLLVDTDNDGVFSDETPIGGAIDLGGNIYEFSSVSALANNARFTMGTINVGATPLPVKLLTFEANLDDDKVDLKWVTSTEINNDFFTIERSKDGKNWKTVSNVSGAGNSNQTIEYFDSDYKPFKGISYYRLKQTDFDGTFTYSNVVPVKFIKNGSGFSLFPNPVERGRNVQLQFEDIAEDKIVVVLRDIKGQEYYSQVILNVEDGVLVAIPIDRELPVGTYIVIASSENQVYSQKLLVK